jgi:hypothetical protein
MSIKRFDIEGTIGTDGADMVENATGEFVKYTDYEDLAKKLINLGEEFSRGKNRFHVLEREIYSLQSEIGMTPPSLIPTTIYREPSKQGTKP